MILVYVTAIKFSGFMEFISHTVPAFITASRTGRTSIRRRTPGRGSPHDSFWLCHSGPPPGFLPAFVDHNGSEVVDVPYDRSPEPRFRQLFPEEPAIERCRCSMRPLSENAPFRDV